MNNHNRESAFRAAMGDPSRTTFWRWRQAGLIPEPDAYLSSAPNAPCLWLDSTIERTQQALLARTRPEQVEAAKTATRAATEARRRSRGGRAG